MDRSKLAHKDIIPFAQGKGQKGYNMFVVREHGCSASAGTRVWRYRYETEREAWEAVRMHAAKRGITADRLEVVDLEEYELSPSEMTDAELIRFIDESGSWNSEAVKELVRRTDMSEEYDAADEVSFENVVYKALEKLKHVI